MASDDAQDQERERDDQHDDRLIERALRRLAAHQRSPLTTDEVDRIREMLADWEYRQRRTKAWRANWPVITLIFSFVMTAVGWAASWIASHWGIK